MINFAFFGSSRLSIIVLDEMKKAGTMPKLVITTADKPQGRKLIMTPNVVKTWAQDNSVPCLDLQKMDASFMADLIKSVQDFDIDLFVVASYGKIISHAVLEIPKHGALNIHPSLLPKYRGPSPLPTAILDDRKKTGVTIMKMDDEMDHGPIVATETIEITEWPNYDDFEEMMAVAGAKLLIETMPRWIAGKITATPQNHSEATYTKKIAKSDAEISFDDVKPANTTSSDKLYEIFRKIQAYSTWPQAYFFLNGTNGNLRVKITRAKFSNGTFTIERVIPEGSKEMDYSDFLKGYIK